MDPVAAWAAGALVGASVGFFYGSRMRRDRDRDWRRSFNHENTNNPSGPPPLKLLRSKPTRELLFFESPIARSNNGPGPTTAKPVITPVGQQPTRRVYHFNPATIAECGGPCEEGGPGACDCGAVTWTDRPVKPIPPGGRLIRENELPRD